MSKLKKDFELLRDNCIEIRKSYNNYTILFQEENREILTRVAATFFSDLAEIMCRDWILQACKLMDPAKTKKQGKELENITIELVNDQLKSESLLNSEIERASNAIIEYGKKIKSARDKRIAHSDREHQIKKIVLGQTTEDELDSFLQNIQGYCDLVGNVLSVGPLDFSCSSCTGDVLDLLKYLNDSSCDCPTNKVRS